MAKLRPLWALMALFAVAGLLAACGGDDTDDGGTATGSNADAGASSGVEESREAAEAAFTVPTEIPVETGFDSAPAPKTAAFIEPQIPAGISQTAGFQAAADAMGWELVVIPTDPFQPAGAVQQAIDRKVDFIMMTGAPTALFAEQLAAADRQGIPVLSCFGSDVPGGAQGPDNQGLYAQCGDNSAAEADGALLADWAISDSDGSANILSVNIPDYPILVAQEKGFEDRLAANCPDCSLNKLGVTVDDLAQGAVPQEVASRLQSDPNIDYVFFTMSDLPTGVYDTLAGAGLAENVKLFGLDFNEERLQALEAGEQSVALGLPKEYAAWLQFQFAAELAENGEIANERRLADLPRILVGPEEAGQYMDTRFQWPGPEGFQEQFQELWKTN